MRPGTYSKSRGNNNVKKLLEDAHAPYNFISLWKTVPARYKKIEELPSHAKYEEGRANGYIEYLIEAKTHIIIAGGNNSRDDKSNEKHFFRNSNKKYAVPGSTIRGLLRSNANVLSLSSLGESIEDKRFLYRTFADNSKKLRDEYKDRVGLKTAKTERGKTYSSVENVKGGYIVKEGKDRYYIQPAKEIKEKSYFRINEGKLRKLVSSNLGIKYMYEDEKGFRENRSYSPYCVPISFSINEENLEIKNLGRNERNTYSGYILCSGSMKKKKSHYIIPEIDMEGEKIYLTEEEIRSYNDDLARKKQRDQYYILPDKIGTENKKAIFYSQYKGNNYFGFTPYLRIFYDHSILSGVPRELKDNSKIDYVKALFGFANLEYSQKEDGKQKKESYKSRLSFLDAQAEGEVKPLAEERVVLGEPKATCFPNYLEQPNGRDKNKLMSYNDKSFRIRGIKQFWLKGKLVLGPPSNNSKVCISISPLAAGTKFKGRIYFENLAKDELGLILWSIKLKEGSRHNIGLGKPYGYGEIEFQNLKLYVEDLAKKYKEFSFNYLQEEEINSYIDYYKEYFEKSFKLDIEKQDAVKDLMTMKSLHIASVESTYMALNNPQYNPKNEFSHRAVLPTVSDLRGKMLETSQAFQEEPKDMTKALQKLQNKFKR